MKPLTLTPRQLEQAAHAWSLGCQCLGARCARNKLIYAYGRVVQLVREHTGDQVDYSQEGA